MPQAVAWRDSLRRFGTAAECLYRRRCELGPPAWLNPVARGNIRAWGAQVARRNSHSVVALRGVLKFSSVQIKLVILFKLKLENSGHYLEAQLDVLS